MYVTQTLGHHIKFMECGHMNFLVHKSRNKQCNDKFIKVYKPDVLCIIYMTIKQFVLQLFIAFLDG